MNPWAAIAIVAMVAVMTYVMRAGVIVALADRTIPVPVERALRNVGPAVLAALAINLAAGGEGGPSLEFGEFAALLAGGSIAWWRKNLILTLFTGMVVLWLVSALA